MPVMATLPLTRVKSDVLRRVTWAPSSFRPILVDESARPRRRNHTLRSAEPDSSVKGAARAVTTARVDEQVIGEAEVT